MRTRKITSDLPQRLYCREGKRDISWTYKIDGRNKVLSTAKVGDKVGIESSKNTAVRLAMILNGAISSVEIIPKTPIEHKIVREREKKDLKSAPMWAWNLYRKAKADAYRREIGWNLKPEQFSQLVQDSGGLCAVSGIPFTIPTAKARGPIGPSLDRIESEGDYSIDNVRLVCVAVNVALNVWGLDIFMKIATATVQKNISYIPKN